MVQRMRPLRLYMPQEVLELNDRVKCEGVRQDDCIGCRQCDNICPDLAITVKEREQ